ncbi:TPA: ATP-dependent Clp protease proteolytic subunit [Burkholderia vietnamiensis]|nr:ATP-dependent Clp protease proteolytic subunit [Burkholderia vietnamiensis]
MTKHSQRIRADMEDMELDMESDEGPVLKVFTTQKVHNEHSIYLSTPVAEPAAYDEVCHLLRIANEEDQVKLYLNTPGGALISGLALIQAMRESKATITTILNPQAFSMGALIFLCGDVRVAPPNSLLMFHHYSGGQSGKGNELVAELAATSTWFEEAMQNTCSPFLTKKEIKDVLEGKDIWMGSTEINRRLQDLKRVSKK